MSQEARDNAQIKAGCPFQDDKPHNIMFSGVKGIAWIECMECGARGPISRWGGQAEAVAKWNTRTHWIPAAHPKGGGDFT